MAQKGTPNMRVNFLGMSPDMRVNLLGVSLSVIALTKWINARWKISRLLLWRAVLLMLYWLVVERIRQAIPCDILDGRSAADIPSTFLLSKLTHAEGFVFGGAFGLIMTSFEYSSYTTPGFEEGKPPPPLRQQLLSALKDSGTRSYSMAKNFAMVGAVYASTECIIEGYRAKHDVYNSVSAGCITGGILSAKAGPQAALLGCAGFAAFSAAIDYFLESR